MIRENIFAAVAGFFTGIGLFTTVTRDLKHWDNCSPEEQPALYLQQERESAIVVRGLPTRWTFHMLLWLYVHTGANNDQTIVPATLYNPLLDAITNALKPDNGTSAVCTLGGLVSHAAIEGETRIFEGNLGDQAVVLIPLTIVVPT